MNSDFSALMLFVGWQKGIWPVKKTEWWNAGMVVCLGRDADLHMAQLMPLPLTTSCSSKSRLALLSLFYLSGTGSAAQPSSPGQSPRGRKTVVVVTLTPTSCVIK